MKNIASPLRIQVIALFFILSCISITETEQASLCFCDSCVASNYDSDPNGIEYGTGGK